MISVTHALVALTSRALGLVLAAVPSHAGQVTFETANTKLTAELFRPEGPGPFPAVVALHGCGGLYTRNKSDLSARHRDWADRLVQAGYAVMFPDSFSSRGFDEICTKHDRPITPEDRATDAIAAALWLKSQSGIDPSRINILGWSHGAMSLLWAIGTDASEPSLFASATAFYPGCRKVARKAGWRPAVPLTILSGANDDWTEPGPCRELAEKAGFRFIEYPGAYHDFDAPNIPVHIRTGLSAVRSGQAHIGTNPDARRAAIDVVMQNLATAHRP